ncbi:Protein CBG27663 [Caenorhabditis briggsae]|uniref:Protein CBG27663 n=1 Tax=Caenorhabditis briggsae TaxID=6238 RepID=B6IJA8_CAEBR|nr:Protein CBG27663 [Caenorhabditis briggsae]CAR99942.1 Protein CBG27663 [Caenorhabditis briggsae]
MSQKSTNKLESPRVNTAMGNKSVYPFLLSELVQSGRGTRHKNTFVVVIISDASSFSSSCSFLQNF